MKAEVLIVALFLVLLLLCLGCEVSKSKEDIEGYKLMDYKPRDLTPRACYVTNVIVIDDCEYIVTGAGKAIVHKANCKNPLHIIVK